jgi:hypothetical protein
MTHGVLNTLPEYRSWKAMRRRCHSRDARQWPWYGGRGIKICERWGSFENFLADMGPRPTAKHTLDRIDSDGDYSPENCRWSDAFVQNRNRTHILGFVAVSLIRHMRRQGAKMADLAHAFGVTRTTVRVHLASDWALGGAK